MFEGVIQYRGVSGSTRYGWGMGGISLAVSNRVEEEGVENYLDAIAFRGWVCGFPVC